MITKNINGTNISSGFISQIQSDSPNVIARLWYNNSELLCDIVDITVEKGSCGQQNFMVGDVIGDMLTATVKDLSTDIKGEIIECHIGALVNGSYEYVSLGRFRVSEVKKTRYESQITAYSTIVADTGTRLDVTGLNNPTIAQIASKVAGKLNCTVTFDIGINTSYQVGAQLDGLTYYQALQVIAICCGGYVVNTNDGNVRVHRFSTTTNLNVNTGMMVKLPEIAEQSYKVESVGVLVSEATTDNNGNPVDEIFYSYNPDYIIVTKQGTDYYLKARNGQLILANLKPESADVYFSCQYMTEQMFKNNIMSIRGYEYYPATIGLTLGDPRLEGCDVLNVTDVDGNTYTVPCHKVVHKYTGGFTSEITSCEASDKANSVGTSFPITQRFETQARQIGTAQATADNAYKIAGDTNQYFWFTGSGSDTGAHITETPQAQFIADPQNGGGNLLARSNGVAIRDGLTELATFGAYGANINENGVSIANFGSTARVGKADSSRFLMNASNLEAYDDENNRYFEVSADGMTYGGNNVASQGYADGVAQTAEENGKKEATNYMYVAPNGTLSIASADPSTATRKVEISSSAVKVQNDANNHADVTSSGLEVYQGGNKVAEFGSTATIGQVSNGFSRSEIASDGMKILRRYDDNDIKVAHLGFGMTSYGVLEPFYTFGDRDETQAVGHHSATFGQGCTAEAPYSFSAGNMTKAGGFGCVAFGERTEAGGTDSFTAGFETRTRGIAQAVFGAYNVRDTSVDASGYPIHAFIVGIGRSDLSRRNAFAVDQYGNAYLRGNLYTNCNDDSSGGYMMTMAKVSTSSVSSLPATINNSVINSSMEVVNCVLSNPSAQTGDWTVTTSNGSLTISGSISGTTNITLYLAVPRG